MGERPVLTRKTHMVVGPEKLRAVEPGVVYYEGEPGSDRDYSFVWNNGEGRLEVQTARECVLCARVRTSHLGDKLHVRWGSVAGRFPASFRSGYGQYEVFVREADGELARRLSQPPARVPRPSREHQRLGRLVHDGNLQYWSGQVALGERAGISLSIDGPEALPESRLAQVAHLLDGLELGVIKAYAAGQLLAIKNEHWTDSGESGLTEAQFASRLSATEISVGGDITVSFDDGGLFAGHRVAVSLDLSLRCQTAWFDG